MPEPAGEVRFEPSPQDPRRPEPRDPAGPRPLTPKRILWRLVLLALLLAGFVWIYFLAGPRVETETSPPAEAPPAEATAAR